MFDILENIAYYEAKSDPKKFAKTKKTATTKMVPPPTVPAHKPRRSSILNGVKEIVFPMKNNAPNKKKRISKEMSSTMETIQNNADSGSDDLMRSNSIQPRKKSLKMVSTDDLGTIGRSKSKTHSGHAEVLTFETDEKGLDN